MATSSGEVSLTSDLGRNSTSEKVQRATKGARVGSLAAGAQRSGPPAAPPHAPAGTGRLHPPSTGRCPTPPPAASTSVHRSRQAASGQAHGRREAPLPRAEAGCGCAARAAGGRCCRRGPPEAACSGARDGRTVGRGDGRDGRTGRRPTVGQAAGAKAKGRGNELRQAQASGGRGCDRVARLAWAAGQAATKPHANPRLRRAEA
ncbi:atherin-like [Panicum virgatum]|uniref:atherin-like n=1 Tax=Panicum virgatum TaxID=38727 RepID=UPI0019D64431|nr:atherin-like [Panicum virgatum]